PLFLYSMLLPAPLSTLFPYTTLFRSLIRIIWIVATLVIYLGFKTYNFSFPLVLIKLVPLVLLWFAVRKDGIDFLSGPKNYPLFLDRKSTRLNSSHVKISYAVFCLKKK